MLMIMSSSSPPVPGKLNNCTFAHWPTECPSNDWLSPRRRRWLQNEWFFLHLFILLVQQSTAKSAAGFSSFTICISLSLLNSPQRTRNWSSTCDYTRLSPDDGWIDMLRNSRHLQRAAASPEETDLCPSQRRCPRRREEGDKISGSSLHSRWAGVLWQVS